MTTHKSEFLNVLEERGFIHQVSDLEGLDAKLAEGPQSAYIGFDATAKSLHVGNLINIMMLHWFQKTGNKPITLMGGGTSKIGDPSFKDESRNLLDDAVIDENIEHIRTTCFTQFLNYGDGETDAMMINNDEWLSELKYLEFLRDYGRHFTINRMIGFDSVKTRLERESPLTLLEFNYMVMQGYDFLEINRRYGTILQMGGSDQWGNMINGVELYRKRYSGLSGIGNALKDNIHKNMSLFALTTPLLTTPDGRKMGKTEGGAVWLNKNMLSPYDYYQFWRNVDDAMVAEMLAKFTLLPMDEVRRLSALEGAEINEAKKILAFEATKLCHGEEAAKDAEGTAQKVFEQGGVGGDLPQIDIDFGRLQSGVPVIDLFVEAGLVSSKGEIRRLIKGKGARVNDNVIDDDNAMVDERSLTLPGKHIKLSAGKKKHALVKVG